MSPGDTISLLTHGRLFREAVRLAKLFEHQIAPIFKGLAHSCLYPVPKTTTATSTQQEFGSPSEYCTPVL